MLSGRIVASVITVQCLNEPKLRGTFTIHNFDFAGMTGFLCFDHLPSVSRAYPGKPWLGTLLGCIKCVAI